MPQEILLTTPQVAKRLGVSVRRGQALIHAGRLPSQQFGRDHVIKEEDLALVAIRKRGRAPKGATDGNATPVKAATNARMSAKTGKLSKKKASSAK